MNETGARFYEKLEDGTLKPLTIPAWAVERAATYNWLRGEGLTDEAIRLVWMQ